MKLLVKTFKEIIAKLGLVSFNKNSNSPNYQDDKLGSSSFSTKRQPFNPTIRFRLLGAGCIVIASALVLWQIPGSKLIDSGAFDTFTAPIMEAAPLVSVNDVDATPEPLDTIYQLTVAKGDTLMSLLTKQGIGRTDAHNAIQALSKLFDPRKLKPGQEMELLVRAGTGENTDKAKIISLKVKANITKDIVVSSTKTGFDTNAVEHPLTTQVVSTQGSIESSLYVAALKADMPQKILGSLINVFSFDVDFQREIRVGDTFAAMYEQLSNDEGKIVDSGNVLIGEMTVQGKQTRFYRHKDKDGFVDYYDTKGRSVRKALLRTPVDGARITSSFGNRKHPTLGYNKKHTGIDFGARTGTPIYAAGNGTIEFAGRNGGYGNYVRIKHTGRYKTAYAHMSRFAKGIRKGTRVQQRQVIGYVGSTGRSTGPHLHYEVHRDNVKVNPLSVKLPTGKTLKGNELAAFKKTREKLDTQFAELPSSVKIAEAPSGKSN